MQQWPLHHLWHGRKRSHQLRRPVQQLHGCRWALCPARTRTQPCRRANCIAKLGVTLGSSAGMLAFPAGSRLWRLLRACGNGTLTLEHEPSHAHPGDNNPTHCALLGVKRKIVSLNLTACSHAAICQQTFMPKCACNTEFVRLVVPSVMAARSNTNDDIESKDKQSKHDTTFIG
jgi:hypothetical protein